MERPYPKPRHSRESGNPVSGATASNPTTEPASPMDSRFRGSNERAERPYPNPVIPAHAGIQ